MATKKSNGTKITIDQLARIISKGFDTQAKHFEKTFDQKLDEKLDEKIGGVNIRLTRIEKDLTIIKGQLTDVVHEPKFEKLEGRVDYLENIMAVKKD
jgi:hypothetical protein